MHTNPRSKVSILPQNHLITEFRNSNSNSNFVHHFFEIQNPNPKSMGMETKEKTSCEL